MRTLEKFNLGVGHFVLCGVEEGLRGRDEVTIWHYWSDNK
jgi:hypothetical protein